MNATKKQVGKYYTAGARYLEVETNYIHEECSGKIRTGEYDLKVGDVCEWIDLDLVPGEAFCQHCDELIHGEANP